MAVHREAEAEGERGSGETVALFSSTRSDRFGFETRVDGAQQSSAMMRCTVIPI